MTRWVSCGIPNNAPGSWLQVFRGVFAAGEIQDSHFRQVATSVGQGVSAALEAQKFLDNLENVYPEMQTEWERELALA
jgi:hypothetical protein